MKRILCLFAIVAFCTNPSRAAETVRPNIVLIMADDFGYECVTANGGQSYQTPNLDRLAATGIRFEHCHVQPLCTPTRVQLMTGRYNVCNYTDFGTLPRTETTFAQLLKKTGYATGICGKWQLGHEVDSPQHFGFDEALLWHHTRRPPRYANAGLELNGVKMQVPQGGYGPTVVNDFAIDFITKHKAAPFLLYYPMMLTHDPFQPTPDSPDWDPTTNSENKLKGAKHFAEMTVYMDKLIGRLDAKLNELGIRENTLLLFIGDNGTSRNMTSQFNDADFQGGKGTTTHRGTHVPMIASWPSVIKLGSVNTDLISSVDFLPTLCAAAGAETPAGSDGISFLPQLHAKKGTPRDWLYSWYSPRQGAERSVREFAFDHRFKLYRSGEFYNLVADSEETKPLDLAALDGESAAAAKKLQAALDQYKDARPTSLDLSIQDSTKDEPLKKKKKDKDE